MSAWGARQLQIVWFAQTRFEPKAREIFALLTTEEPTATQTGQMPSPTGLTPFELAQGMTPQYVYNVQKQQNRIDLIIQPSPDIGQDDVSDKFENVMEMSELLKNWGHLITDNIEHINRVGIVANLIVDANSQESANKNILSKIGLTELPFGKGTDVNLQINFPSQREWGRLNRITRWQIETFRNVQVTMQGSLQLPSMGPNHYASALMVDFNTIVNASVMDNIKVKDVISEAVSDISYVWDTGILSRLEK